MLIPAYLLAPHRKTIRAQRRQALKVARFRKERGVLVIASLRRLSGLAFWKKSDDRQCRSGGCCASGNGLADLGENGFHVPRKGSVGGIGKEGSHHAVHVGENVWFACAGMQNVFLHARENKLRSLSNMECRLLSSTVLLTGSLFLLQPPLRPRSRASDSLAPGSLPSNSGHECEQLSGPSMGVVG